jgi:hypothetical protein
MRAQFIACGIVPVKPRPHTRHFWGIVAKPGTHWSRGRLAIPKPRQRLSCDPRFDSPHSLEISMTITAAHISPIVALIAGVLILIMPRFLNFILAIYLIVVGLAGLGVFKMFRF